MTSKIHFGGLPTGPDVKKLEEAFGTPEPGLIKHEEIEAVIGERRGTSRYRTVVNAWRKQLFNTSNVEARAEPGLGILFMTAKERSENGVRGIRHAARHVVRVVNRVRAVPVDELDEVTRRKHDHLLRQGALLGEAAVKTTTDLRKALKAPAQLRAAGE